MDGIPGRRPWWGYLLVMLVACWVSSVHADTYKYVDSGGTVVMTDRYDSIPKQYRGRVTVIRDAPTAKSFPVPSAPGALSERDTAPSQPGSGHELTWRDKYLIPTGFLLGLIATFFIIRWISTSLGLPRLGTVVFLCLALGTGIFVYRLYIEQMTEVFSKLKADAFNIKKNVETRGEKTNNSMREMETK